LFAEIEVSDTGFGIRPEDQVRIFEPFERGQQPNGAAVPGTGLGLTITKMLVQVMGGEISLISKPGEGSVFKVGLLLSEVTYPSASPKSDANIIGYKGRRRSIVVADDDRTHCAILAEVLGPLGFRVIVVDSGASCLDTVREHKPDLVLLDVSMPEMSGWEVAAELRERVSPMTRIVMLTGSAFEIDSHRDAVKYYDAAHIKPFYVGSLLQTIADVLDLEWIVEKESVTFNGGEKVRPDDDDAVLAGRKLPDMRELIDLRRLGEIGYVRGIREKLSDIASQSPDYRWLVDRLEPMSRDLDFPQYIAVLSELIEQEP
jgi:CheY-like chemotaxis protein